MSLRLAGEEALQERIECIAYVPGLANSGDLEAVTKTITATSEASGVGNADYSTVLTLSTPSSAKLEVLRVAARLAVTIDGLGGDTNLYCRVYIDAQDADHLLFDEDWTSPGAKLDAVDTHDSNKATIFNLLKDGAAHTFYFFWKAGGGTGPVVSLVQLWEAVGTSETTAGGGFFPLRVAHRGSISFSVFMQVVGSGTPSGRVNYQGAGNAYFGYVNGGNVAVEVPMLLCDDTGNGRLRLQMWGTVATDINYCGQVIVLMRRLE